MTVGTLSFEGFKAKTATLDTLSSDIPLVRSVSEFLLMKEAGRSARTAEYYRYWLNKLVRFSLERDVDSAKNCTVATCNLFMLDIRAKHAPQSQALCYTAIKSFFAWLVQGEELGKNPMARLEKPAVPEKDPVPYKTADLGQLIAGFKGHSAFVSARMLAVLSCATDTGMRKGEIVGLRVDDLYESEEQGKPLYVKVRSDNVKTRTERHLRLGMVASAAMRKYLSARAALLARKAKRGRPTNDKGALFLSEEGSPLTGAGLYNSIRRECERTGVKVPRRLHAFRNTAGIQFLQNDGGEIALQAMYGHKTSSMTRHYVRAAERENYHRAHRKASPMDNMKL